MIATNASRAAVILSIAWLSAACAGDPASGPAGDPAIAPVAGQTPPPSGEQVSAVPHDEPPATVEQARAQCWMRYESGRGGADLDRRLALVEKCVDEKMRNASR